MPITVMYAINRSDFDLIYNREGWHSILRGLSPKLHGRIYRMRSRHYIKENTQLRLKTPSKPRCRCHCTSKDESEKSTWLWGLVCWARPPQEPTGFRPTAIVTDVTAFELQSAVFLCTGLW